MKTIFYKLTKILLLTLICCPSLLTQPISYIVYDGYDDYNGYFGYSYNVAYFYFNGIENAYKVFTDKVWLVIKKDYYNDELLEKLKNPPYSSIYSLGDGYFITSSLPDTIHFIHLDIKDNLEDINILYHYLKFKKEEFVEEVVPYAYFLYWTVAPNGYFINGQILYNSKPLSNHLVNVKTTLVDTVNMYHPPIDLRNCITVENGNYVLQEWLGHMRVVPKACNMSFKIGNSVYDTTFILDDDKTVDWNVTSAWKEFEVKGQILQNGKPVTNRNITLTDQFDFVCNGITDEDGNYFFPYMREDYEYTLSCQVGGDTKCETTFVLDEDKNLDFNFYASTFDIKGQVLHNGKPLSNNTIYIHDQFNLYKDTTDENGNYIFPEMIEKYDYTLFFKIGADRYDTTFVLDGNKVIDFNIDVETININSPKDIPTTYSLSQNYPNPFNPSTKIEYSLPEASMVRLSIYNSLGQEVATLVNSNLSAGKYSVDFNAANLSSGIYFYRLQSEKFNAVKKMMLLK